MTTYRGVRNPDGKFVVTVEGGGKEPRVLDPRTDVRPHSRDGFDWGCGSPGSAQLALALCIDALKDERRAFLVHQAFKHELVKGWPRDGWHISQENVIAVIEMLEASPLRQNGAVSTQSEAAPF